MKDKHTQTVVDYIKNGVLYQHIFEEILSHQQVEQRVVMMFHANRSDITAIDYQ